MVIFIATVRFKSLNSHNLSKSIPFRGWLFLCFKPHMTININGFPSKAKLVTRANVTDQFDASNMFSLTSQKLDLVQRVMLGKIPLTN